MCSLPARLRLLPVVLALAAGCGGGAGGAGDGPAPAFGPANGIGTRYGAHDPRTCPDRKQPADGPPSAAQAAGYTICGREGETANLLYLMDRVEVTGVAKGRPYNPIEDRNMGNVDIDKPVYAIRGRLTHYQCSPLTTEGLKSVGFADNTGSNCNAEDEPNAGGLCYQDTFGDWSCSMVDINGTNRRDKAAPPKAAS